MSFPKVFNNYASAGRFVIINVNNSWHRSFLKIDCNSVLDEEARTVSHQLVSDKAVTTRQLRWCISKIAMETSHTQKLSPPTRNRKGNGTTQSYMTRTLLPRIEKSSLWPFLWNEDKFVLTRQPRKNMFYMGEITDRNCKALNIKLMVWVWLCLVGLFHDL